MSPRGGGPFQGHVRIAGAHRNAVFRPFYLLDDITAAMIATNMVTVDMASGMSSEGSTSRIERSQLLVYQAIFAN